MYTMALVWVLLLASYLPYVCVVTACMTAHVLGSSTQQPMRAPGACSWGSGAHRGTRQQVVSPGYYMIVFIWYKCC